LYQVVCQTLLEYAQGTIQAMIDQRLKDHNKQIAFDAEDVPSPEF
jgi:hypothetical protein